MHYFYFIVLICDSLRLFLFSFVFSYSFLDEMSFFFFSFCSMWLHLQYILCCFERMFLKLCANPSTKKASFSRCFMIDIELLVFPKFLNLFTKLATNQSQFYLEKSLIFVTI